MLGVQITLNYSDNINNVKHRQWRQITFQHVLTFGIQWWPCWGNVLRNRALVRRSVSLQSCAESTELSPLQTSDVLHYPYITHLWTLTSIWPVDTTSNCSRLFSSNAAFVLLARKNRITSLCRCEHQTLPFTLKALMIENTSLRCGLFSNHAIHLLLFMLCNVSSVCKPASGLLVFYFLQTVEMELMQ